MEIKCRCCLSSKIGVYHSLLSVFPEFEETSSSLLDILRIVVSSQVIFSDPFPSEICESCLNKLKIAFDFIDVFKNSQIFLEKRLKSMEQSQNEENLETIIITGENEDEDSVSTERIVIVAEEGESVPTNFEEIIINEDYSSINGIEEDKEESISEDTAAECSSDLESHSDSFVKDFQKELFETGDGQANNMNNITLMTIDDVLKAEKNEKKTVLSVEDIINSQQDPETSAFICDICCKVFTTKRNLNLHKYRLHNPNWKERFKCTLCEMEYKTLGSWRHHMLKHIDKKFECDLCEKKYALKQHLNFHLRNKHEGTCISKYLCSFCGKRFKTSSALSYHLRVHNNQLNYMCEYCGVRSPSISAMKRHERVHTRERPYNCRYCEATFAGIAEKKKHENIHDGIMPYTCSYCDKRFVQPYNMKVHMLQHTGDNCCIVCGKGFIDEHVLKFHYQHRHKEILGGEENV